MHMVNPFFQNNFDVSFFFWANFSLRFTIWSYYFELILSQIFCIFFENHFKFRLKRKTQKKKQFTHDFVHFEFFLVDVCLHRSQIVFWFFNHWYLLFIPKKLESHWWWSTTKNIDCYNKPKQTFSVFLWHAPFLWWISYIWNKLTLVFRSNNSLSVVVSIRNVYMVKRRKRHGRLGSVMAKISNMVILELIWLFDNDSKSNHKFRNHDLLNDSIA